MKNNTFVRQMLSRPHFHTKRWHFRPVARPENLAEHCFEVARFGFEIGTLINFHQNEIGVFVSPERIAMAALYHDDPEIIMGDVPYPAKLAMGGWDHWDKVEKGFVKDLWPDYPPVLRETLAPQVSGERLTEVEEQVLRYCDKLSAYAKVREEIRMGNKLMADDGHGGKRPPSEEGVRKPLADMDFPWLAVLREHYDLP